MDLPRNLLNQKRERMKHCPQCSTGYPDSLAACPTHGVPLNEIRDLKPGMVVHHSYRILRKLGQGGMGAVYLAQHTLMDEPRALKFLSPELSRDQAFTARFLREVRTLRQIRHRNVVDCGDLESAEDDSLFFSMEFVDGPDLRAFLRDARLHSAEEPESEGGGGFNPRIKPEESARALAPDALYQGTACRSGLQPRLPQMPQIEARALAPAGSLPVPLALHIARQIAEGLAAAHARGMVHRDIKPENILMAREAGAWLPKIADFGIVATKESSTAFTRTGGTLLTVTYAAPEQWRGTPAADLDGRTDLYALGGLLYEMLTGQTVFHALNYEGWAWQHQNTPPPPPSTLRPDLANWQGLDALVLRLLAKDRNDRPRDVAELIGLLDAVRLVQPEARRETVKEDAGKSTVGMRSKRVHIWVWAASIAVLLVTAFVVARIFWLKLPTKPTDFLADAKPVASEQAPARTNSPNFTHFVKDTSEIEQRAEAFDDQKRYSDAKSLYEQACSGGNGLACANIGVMFFDGHGVVKDYSRAEKFFSKACDAGNGGGCYELGFMYETGAFGVDKHFPKALTLYSKACGIGYVEGCEGLGSMYGLGEGVPRDQLKAARYDSKACDGGIARACSSLSDIYAFGAGGIEQDIPRAQELARKACTIKKIPSSACVMPENQQ
jgi:serine/threonine protein kinase